MAGGRGLSVTLAANVGSVLAQQLSIYGISLLTFGIIARLLTPIQLGLYALVVSMVHLFSAAANLGIKRFGVWAISSRPEEGVRIFWACTMLALAFIALISFAVTYVACLLRIFDVSNPSVDPYLFYTLLFLYSLKVYISCGLEGLRLFHRVTVYVSTGFLIYRILMIYAALMGYGVTGIMAAWCVGEGIAVALILRDTLPRFTPFTLDYSLREVVLRSLPLTASDLVVAALDWADRLVISVYGYSSIAIFYIAATGTSALTAIAQAVYSGTLPHLSESFHRGNPGEFSAEVRRIGKYIALFASPIYILAMALGQPTIIILVGPQYLSATIVFQVMAFGLWITSLSPLIHTALIAAGRWVSLMYVMVAALATDILFILIAFPYLGVVAAGIGRALLMAVSFALALVIAQDVLDLDIDMAAILKSMAASLLMAVIVIVMWTYVRHISLYPLYVLAGAAIYLGLIRLLRVVDVEDLAILYSSVPHRLIPAVKLVCRVLGVDAGEVERRASARLPAEK